MQNKGAGPGEGQDISQTHSKHLTNVNTLIQPTN